MHRELLSKHEDGERKRASEKGVMCVRAYMCTCVCMLACVCVHITAKAGSLPPLCLGPVSSPQLMHPNPPE